MFRIFFLKCKIYVNDRTKHNERHTCRKEKINTPLSLIDKLRLIIPNGFRADNFGSFRARSSYLSDNHSGILGGRLRLSSFILEITDKRTIFAIYQRKIFSYYYKFLRNIKYR